MAGRGSFTRDSTESDFEIAAQITAGATRRPGARRILVYYGHALDGDNTTREGMTEVNERATVSGLAHALASMTHRGPTSRFVNERAVLNAPPTGPHAIDLRAFA